MTLGAIVPDGGRGCGDRESGGCYAEIGIGPGGMPIEYFLVDPPQLLDPKLGISRKSAIGVKLIQRQDGSGVWDVYDWIGEENYPNVADMVEEIRHFGMSRRFELASDDEYAKITSDSLYFLIHRRAWIGNCEPYYKTYIPVGVDALTRYNPCPKNFNSHKMMMEQTDQCKDLQPCLGLCWNDIEGGEPYPPDSLPFQADPRRVVRKMPWGEYRAVSAPDLEYESPDYHPAIFFRGHLSRIVVVKGDKSDAKKKKLAKCTLPVEDVEK